MLKDLILEYIHKKEKEKKSDKLKFDFNDEIEIQRNNGDTKDDKLKR